MLKRAKCPSCSEPWLRPTQLPGRFRCVYCLHRFELVSQCPNCGEHQTIARMSTTEDMTCQTVLPLEKRRIIQAVDVVDELPIEVLHSVHVVEVESIVGRVLAGSLDERSGPKSLAVSKVLL